MPAPKTLYIIMVKSQYGTDFPTLDHSSSAWLSLRAAEAKLKQMHDPMYYIAEYVPKEQ